MMKINTLCFSLLTLNCMMSNAWALSLKEAPIQKVTVYPNGALIERSIPVKAGERLIELEGLAANFDVTAIKVQSENIDIGAVTSVDSALNKPSGRESAQLQTQIKQLSAQIAELDAKIQAAELQNKFLGNVTTGQATTIRQQAYDAFLTISTATQQKQELEQRLNELNQDLSQIGDHRFNQRTLQLHVNAPQSGVVHIAYQVTYATWKPSYKAELNTQTRQLTLTRMAMIAQKTGEDWDNIQLTLSTTAPQGTVAQVTPQPWWVNYNEPSKEPIMYEPVPASAAMVELAGSRALTKSTVETSFPQFEQVAQTYSTQFTTTTRASVPSSKQQISLPLDQQQLPASLSVWVIPQQQQRAFLSATIPRITGDYPQGQVKLYRDGDYIGQRAWQNPTAEQMHFNFGEDEQVQVKVINDQRKQDQSGAFSKQITQIQSKQYQVKNLHRQPIDMILFESVPQSQNNALKVTHQFSQAPTATEWQQQKNIYQWQSTLTPQQQFDLNVEYQFKYPQEGYVTGF